ncbi:non-ribosomal peptide synthase/polyketide synthase [Janthinobacterium sp. 17J80-10]|uniref:non-ribosomal peptide synthase/polyketide synthase n=1 Tax=Janthinobacterium sp. 17J80-10 TaxID=2497863 RepID=UPI00100563D0|nr:non-ribosomal peptide synthase/polyketide synthase [Janthinobacterium sp. 17J80-10]QAU34548.1 amino acid adenylation domain-containing protein [Janthinobacterium sp. 17J80-10]
MPAVAQDTIQTFVELLSCRASVDRDAVAFRFLSYPASGVQATTITYGKLDASARRIASRLLRLCQPGDRALMLYPSGIEFIEAYFGCLYAGVIAVPGYPPKRNQKLGRLKSLVQNCAAQVVLADAQTRSIAEPLFAEVDELGSLAWLITDAACGDIADAGADAGAETMTLPHVGPDDIAFLQYTSGSTGDPKGVMVSHGNLIANSRSIHTAMVHSPDTVVVGWLPLFHDMGLIGNVLQPIYGGIPATLMAPASFLQRPLRWLEAISTYRATTSGGPNFAYDLCVSSVSDEELAQLDLSAWTLAFTGAEPIRPESQRAFSARFAACGFDPAAHYACYGMAETTLLVTGGDAGKGTKTVLFDETGLQQSRVVPIVPAASGAPAADKVHELVSCGYARCEQGILIVNPQTLQRCADGEVGEIWAYGDSNAKGYWQKPEATIATFGARLADTGEGPYLRTGDLGFVHGGELFIAGRLKDVVIIRGMNHYPQDIELTAFESHEAFMPNGAAVFTIEEDGEEQLVVVLEVRRTHLRRMDPDALARAIQQAVVLQHELQVRSIVFIKPGQLPKTSSGKVQRQTTKKLFLAGEIEALARVDKLSSTAGDDLPGFDRASWEALPDRGRQAMLEHYVAALFEAFGGLQAGSIRRDVPVIGYGFDSLALTRIAARVADDTDVALQVQHLFEHETVQALAGFLNGALADPAGARARILPLNGSRTALPMSYAQQRMWFLMQYEASSLYNIAGVLGMRGTLDIRALDRAFQEIFRRHEALRTRFVLQDGEPHQMIAEAVDWKLSVVDLSDRSQAEFDDALCRELDYVFDLSQDILFRATVYRQRDGSHALAVCMHHIVSDGWSVAVLMRELSALYDAYLLGKASPLPPLPVQYADYAVWQRDYLAGDELVRQEKYWQQQLQGVAPLSLPTDRARPARPGHAGNTVSLQLNGELTAQLKAVAREHGVTLYMTLLAAFGVLLHKHGGQDDFCIGSPIANRGLPETRDLIGFFVNTLALRTNFAGNPGFDTLLRQVRKTTVDAYAHQDLPFEKVVDVVQPERDLATSPLFQVMFVLQDGAHGGLTLPGLDVQKLPVPTNTAKFDLTLELQEGPEGLAGHFEYRSELFDAATVLRLSAHFRRLLDAIVKSPAARLGELSLLDADERHTLLELWNDTAKTFRQPERLHHLFARQLALTPDAPAVRADAVSLSYAELDSRANRLAHCLAAGGVGAGTLVGLCVERSLDMVVGMLAILKAGGAYVPLDPGYPRERLQYMLQQSQARVLLTRPQLVDIFAGHDVATVLLDPADPQSLDAWPTDDPQVDVDCDDLAYVIYTSGSTGRPKGVPITHAAICNQMGWVLNQFPLQADDRMLQKTPFSFDASVWEIWAPLVSGAQLVLAAPDAHQDVDYLVETIIAERITQLQLVPALLRAMLASPAIGKVASLRRIFLGGEALPVELARQALHLAGKVVNLYGPTECSINASWFDMDNLPAQAQGYVPIGRPVSNLQFYVVDAHLQPVPVGVAGELYISGTGLSPGYLHQPQLSAERFIHNPFNTYDSPTLYKTGDLVRYLPGGQLEFIARIDEQIKIRGFRIELGEVEEILARQAGVVDSAVAVKGSDGLQRLVAYVVADDAQLSHDDLRARLAQALPEYMVPSVFVSLPELPKNSSGKVDRKALPEPLKPNYTEYRALATSTEKALAQIWSALLDGAEIHGKSNFFHIGGHSLLAARMVAQIRERWKIAFAIRNVFEAQELHALAALIEFSAGFEQPGIARVSRDGVLALSHAQQRMWVVNQLDGNSAQYNMPAAIDLDGRPDIQALERAFDAFIARHEILRTVYRSEDGLPVQGIRDAVDFALGRLDLSSLHSADQALALQACSREEAMRPFDLSQDLMLRGTLVGLAEDRHTLLVTMHHIASDGWSTGVLVRELSELYGAFVEGRKAALPELACQYADYAAWQRQTLSGTRLASLLSYWRGQLAQLPVVHNLPLDHARPATPSYRGAALAQVIPAGVVAGLQRLANEQGATLFMVLHAAFASLLHRYSGESDIVIGTPVANRELVELEPLVGLFVNTLVLRTDFSENPDFAGLLQQGRATLADGYEHQDLPFEMLVNELQVERSQSFNPLFQVMLVFQSGGESRLQLSGLQTSAIRETAGATKFDLTLNAVESPKGLKLSWEYATDLFEPATVQRLAESFSTLLDAIVAAPQQRIKRLPLVPDDAARNLLELANAYADDAFPAVCSHLLFEAQTARTPDAIALRYEDQALSYAELNQRANRLAHRLVRQGVTPDTLIGLCAERSPDMVIALLAILKAGGAYVPFDPAYPAERLRYMLEDSGVDLVVTQRALCDTLPLSSQRIVLADDPTQNAASEDGNIDAVAMGLTPLSLAYVIYTSGSTGNPKASLLMHQGLSNLAQAQIEYFHVDASSRLIQFASIAFDAATSEIFMALGAGACLHIIPREMTQSGQDLSDYVARHGITHATLPPALLPVLEREKWASVAHLTVAGEHCPLGLVREWAQERNFYNAYGPSEASVCSSMAKLSPQSEVVHMGRPMRGVQLHVLDDLLQPVPLGVAGQLHVGGRGVGRGYLGREELNREKFLANPFGQGKLYATGDLVRRLADGNLEFIGRLDNQVKIRGFRIELGEVEAALQRQPGIADCAVLALKDHEGQARLVAYIVASDAAVSTESLRASLGASMPGYLIPSAFVQLECFPMTPNGKVDRKRLPAPDAASLVKVEYVAPRNPTEEGIAAIWCALLGLEEVGVHHNFFDLGGNSLLAIQAISRIKETFGVQMKVADLFVYTNIASLARRVQASAANPDSVQGLPLVAPRSGGEVLPLSLEQQSYWFLYELEGGSATYNIPAAIRLNGRLDIAALERSFGLLIERHESLRTVLVVENGQPSQKVLPQVDFHLIQDERKESRYREVLDKQIELDARHVLDLRREIPLRAVLHKLHDDDHVLTILLHHTMADGWSLDILIRDLAQIYNALVAGRENPLAPLPVQFGDYALWQKEQLAGAHYDRQVAYWRDTLKGVPPMLDLPTDYPRPPVQSYRGRELGFALPFELTRALNEFARKNKTTLFNTLMAGLNVLLSRYSRSEDIAVGTAIANRSQTDLESLIGCFANTLVIRNRVEQQLSFTDLVKRVNTVVFDAYEHAGVPFDVVVDAVQPERSLGVPPIFQVMFRLHNQRAGHGIEFAGMGLERIRIGSDSAKLDLNFSLVETETGLEGVIEYATDLFSEKTVRRIARHYQLLLESAMVDANAAIESLNLLSREEFAQVEQWNDTQADYPQNECMYQLFEASAARVPEQLAYVCGDVRLSYAQLNAQANRLAHYLQSRGVGPEVKVGVSVGRSAWAGICMLAVFKSGGTYVPLDPKYPKERIDIMLDVVKPGFILSVPEIAGLFEGNAAQLILVDRIGDELATQPAHNPPAISADHSAYILFTSGTTGRPKAILVGHRAFRNMAESHRWARLHGATSRVLQFASLSFSISMWDSFMAWVPGATLVAAAGDEDLPGEALYELLQREQVTHATWPVSLLSTLPVERMPASLQTIISSAEPCHDAVVARWTARGVRFLNMYGNSEVSLGSTLYEYHRVGQKLTIGVAFPNTRMYLLDRHLRQVPVGVIAEIHTAGAGLATCYWDNPEATDKSFIADPFTREGGRLYKTGDLGRYLPNGEIEFIGREDFQVSIRGFRVELTEIESVLRESEGIAEVVVVSQPDANQVARLVCFYVEKGDGQVIQAADPAALRALVARKLPSYMVPSLFVRLDAMPLTPNRKIDRLGLPRPTTDGSQGDHYVAPRNALERTLATIWGEVLGLTDVGVGSNFFEVGGHSLLAVQVVARVRDSLGLPLTIKDLFSHNTIESLAAFLAGLEGDAGSALPPIGRREASGPIPLSLDQKPYWFLHQLEGGSHTYNIPFAMRLHGKVDVKALEQSLQALVQRHESLRTLFPVTDGEPAQAIVANPAFSLPMLALAAGEVEQAVRTDLTHVFDLTRELPLRARLLQVDDGTCVVTLVLHHVVADGWSLNILVSELLALYSAFSSGAASPLPPLALQYGDYSQWQHQNVVGAVYERQTAFWKAKLAGLSPLLNLPLDYPRPPVQSYRGRELPISLPFALTARLNQYARQHNTTLYNLLLSGLAILLSRYGRTDDVPVGTAVANRPQKELEGLIGCFANTLVIRCRIDPKRNFEQLVDSVGAEALDAFSNGSVPFDGIVEAVQPERSLGVPPVFQVMFRLHNQQMAQTGSFAGLRSELLNMPTESAKLDLNFSLVEDAGGIRGVIEYATDIFNEQTIARIARHYQNVLEAALADTTAPIEQLAVVTAEEMEQVRRWNDNAIAYPQDECVHHLFERAVERTPNKLAYVCGEERFSYAELNARANRLAHFLQSRGVGPEVRVGVSVERSTWAGIGCLAVFKSHGTYVPLDVNYPKDRIERMLDVAKPKIILTLSSVAPLFAGTDAEVICLDTDWEAIQSQPIVNPPRIGASHSAYILFTSGTTGKPKGILVGHRAFRNMAVSHAWAGLHTADSRVLQFASLSFSIALWGAFMAWVPGGTLYSVTAQQALPDEPLYEFLEESQITHVTWPVSMLSTLPVERMPASLKTVISSAEPCNDAVVEKWTRAGVRFLNMYGNSEVSIGSTLYEYRQVGEKLTIGKAFPNTRMYLLDDNLKQVPIGVIAEIHTAGVGLATGYVDDPVATARSFIPDPFRDEVGARMYKTGDLGRYLPNGEIEFIGREDFQVSIRGFRVELTEIEDVLRAIPGMLEAVVNSRDDQQGLARLVCFYTLADKEQGRAASDMRKAVGDRLPNYMVPSLFVRLDAMPLTPNRKIDRLALQTFAVDEGADERLVAPRNAVEQRLALLWADILGVRDIGIHQNFFELGGHSLLATKVVSRIRAEFGIELSLQQFFEHATIEGLAGIVAAAGTARIDSPIRILERRDFVPLSYAQQRLWFLDRYEENSNFYHMPSVLKVVGNVDAAALEKAFVALIARHEVLRTNFIAQDGRGLQKIHPTLEWSMATVQLQGDNLEEMEADLATHVEQQLNTSFRLESDALLRAVLYRLSGDEYRLFINMHHIVSDGWSITVLIREVSALYAAFVSGQAPQLPPLPVQYADFSAWQIEHLQGAVLAQQGGYWSEKLRDQATLMLPLDFERPKNQTYNGDRIAFAIEPGLLAALEDMSGRHGATLFMTMLAAFNVMLSRYSGDTDISIGTPIANRVRAEIEPLIGFFANTLVLRSDLDGNPQFADLLQQVRQTTLEAYSHQDIPFEKVVDLVLPERDPSRSPLFQVSFALQNLPEGKFNMSGVEISTLALENKTAKFDLLLELLNTEAGMSASFEFNTDLFKPQTIRSYIDSYLNLLRAVIADPQCRLAALPLSSKAPEAIDITWASYPLLQALYGENAPGSERVSCILVDAAGHAVPGGAIGGLHLQLMQDGPFEASGFTARLTVNGLELLSAPDDIALVDGKTVYPRDIEAALRQMSGIHDCHVLPRNHPGRGVQLVAYLDCDQAEVAAEDCTAHLAASGLNGVEVFACVKVPGIPLTRHGAADLRQLRKLAVHNRDTRAAWVREISHNVKVRQAILLEQAIEEAQSVSHLADLLPREARSVATAGAQQVSKAKRSDNRPVSQVPAVIISEAIADTPHCPTLLADMLIHTAMAHPGHGIDFYYADSSTSVMTYPELLHRAQCVLSGLRTTGICPGDKVIFQFDRNEDFIAAFWACALGGFIPVPIAAAKNYRASNAQTIKIGHAWKMMDRAIVLAGEAIVDGVRNIGTLEALDGFAVHGIGAMYAQDPAREFYRGSSDDVALIMLTSGSTGLPKGVQLSHANLIGRSMGSVQMNGFNAGMPSMNWMALDHVGGIIYFHIRDIHTGASQVQADTDYILADPLRWLQLIDRHRISITWAPNFAFSLIVERQEQVRQQSLDLSCLKFMLNGAEAVVPKTTQAFIELLQGCGLGDDCVKPVYGMSEISSGVTYSTRLRLTYGSDDTVFVSVGRPIPGVHMRIVDADDQPMMEGQSGRLQVSGVTVTRGYLGGAEINRDAFTADGWFKTGDLAFIQDGELTITGREKDIIIINGVNFYSHEIAEAVETVAGVTISYTGACAVRRNGGNSDQLAIFFHSALKGEARSALMRQIRQTVMEKIGVNPSYLVPLDKEQVPKTEIGKIQLSQLAQAFNRGDHDSILRALDIAERNENTLPDWFFGKVWVERQLGTTAARNVSGATLVFADRSGCAHLLDLPGQVITVTCGQAFQDNADSFRINPSIQEHYVQLVAALGRRGVVIERIISLWDYDHSGGGMEALLSRAPLADAIGLYSAWYLAQAFAAQGTVAPMRWVWAAKAAQNVLPSDTPNPDKAAVLALLKTLGKEFAWLSCRHVDFAGTTGNNGLAADAAQLSREALALQPDEEVAYRDGRRHVLRLRREPLGKGVKAGKDSLAVTAGGAYLISGGLGGIGYALARMLLKQFGTRLLLVGRTPQAELPADKQDMLDELSKLGSVLYAGADICDYPALEKAVDQAEGQWQQKLAGVFHLAGLAHEEAMASQSIHSLHAALRAKTLGTRVLYRICGQRSNALFVNFSSVNGQFGGSGMAAYSIANRYQEAFVEAVAENADVRSVCIAWSLWHDTGMGSQYKETESLSRALGFTPIPLAKGLNSLLAALWHGCRNVLIGLDDTRPNIRRGLASPRLRQRPLLCYFSGSEPDLAREVAAASALQDEFGLALESSYTQLEALPVDASGAVDVIALRRSMASFTPARAEKVAPRDEMEQTLTRIASEVFGASESIGIRDNFFDVGANSLLIVKLHHEIQLQLNVQFPMVELFNSTTVEKLAAFLGEQDGDKPGGSGGADAARNAGQERRAAMQRRNRSRERKVAR